LSIYRGTKLEIEIPLVEYMQSFPTKKLEFFTDKRKCSFCGKEDHYQNLAFIMIYEGKEQRHSISLCTQCIKNKKWTRIMTKYSHEEVLTKWKFYMWRPDSPMPHKEQDKIRIYLDSHYSFYVKVDLNPSNRSSFNVLDK